MTANPGCRLALMIKSIASHVPGYSGLSGVRFGTGSIALFQALLRDPTHYRLSFTP